MLCSLTSRLANAATGLTLHPGRKRPLEITRWPSARNGPPLRGEAAHPRPRSRARPRPSTARSRRSQPRDRACDRSVSKPKRVTRQGASRLTYPQPWTRQFSQNTQIECARPGRPTITTPSPCHESATVLQGACSAPRAAPRGRAARRRQAALTVDPPRARGRRRRRLRRQVSEARPSGGRD